MSFGFGKNSFHVNCNFLLVEEKLSIKSFLLTYTVYMNYEYGFQCTYLMPSFIPSHFYL